MKTIPDLHLQSTWTKDKLTELTLTFSESNNNQTKQHEPYETLWLNNALPIPNTFDLSRLSTFQKNVLTTLRQTKPGDTLTYQELAERAGYPKAARAVGRALATNPYLLVFPCHRVIRKDGDFGNFSAGNNKEEGIKIKQRLLAFEKKVRA